MTTHGDMIFEFGGVPVSNNRYAGWWGNKALFVDDIDGLSGNEGKNPLKAKLTIQEAVAVAGPNDAVFLRPREITVGAHHTHGYYTGNVVIDNALQGLQIIGTGGGGRRGWGSNIQCAIEPDAGSTAATILVQSPGVGIENVMVKAIAGSLGGGIGATNAVANEVYGLTISNVSFKDFIGFGAIGSVNIDSCHWSTIQHCIFQEGGVGINFGSALQAIRRPVVRDCDFWGAPDTWASDIRVSDVSNLVIDDCRFNHALPTGGGGNKYVLMVGTAGTGMISNVNISAASEDISDNFTLVGTTLLSHVFGNGEVVDT